MIIVKEKEKLFIRNAMSVMGTKQRGPMLGSHYTSKKESKTEEKLYTFKFSCWKKQGMSTTINRPLIFNLSLEKDPMINLKEKAMIFIMKSRFP